MLETHTPMMISRDSSATHTSRRVFDDISMSSSPSSSQTVFRPPPSKRLLNAPPTRRTPRCERLLVDRNHFCRKRRKRFFIVFLPVLFEASDDDDDDDDDERGWKLFRAFLGRTNETNEKREIFWSFSCQGHTYIDIHIFFIRENALRLYSATTSAAKTHTEL